MDPFWTYVAALVVVGVVFVAAMMAAVDSDVDEDLPHSSLDT